MTQPSPGTKVRKVTLTQGAQSIICDGSKPFEILPSRDGTIGVAQNSLPVGVFHNSDPVTFTYHGEWPPQ